MRRLVTAAVFAAIAFLLAVSGIFRPADKTLEDYLYHFPAGTSAKVKIVKIDDKTISALGDFESWDRSVYAELVEKLCASDEVKPAVIGFDILFGSDYESAADEEFAEACARHGNVVCAFSYVFEKELSADEYGNLTVDNLRVSGTVEPYAALNNVTKHGFANALMDNDDGFIRSSFAYFPPNPADGETTERSFNAAVYAAYCEAAGIEAELPESAVYSFRYSGKSGGFENVSLCDVLDGSVPAEAFADSIVLVGAYSAGMMDAYYVPVDHSQQMYGVEIHANAVQALLDGRFLRTAPTYVGGIVCALLAGILAFVCGGTGVVGTIVSAAAFCAARLAAGFFLFNGLGLSADVLELPVTAAAIAVYFTAMHYYLENRAKRQIERAFRKYVAPQVVSEIAKSGTYELKLGGETREVAVLFVDIRGFTPLSESLEPEQVVDILNSYLKLTTDCIFRHGGTLDKFIGDATMAVFNAPFDTEDYVYKAVLTAWDIVQGGEKIEREFVERYGKKVGFGVGVNCGRAVVGNIGCDFRMDYTAIGDTVNTAARLEANAPAGTVYISDSVYESVKSRVTAEQIGEIPLKGKSKGVMVYSVTGIDV